MNLGLSGKRALVMGASTGIGKAIAQALVSEGARVALCARNEERLRATADEIGAALALPADLGRPGAAEELVARTAASLGGLDILVTNAGGPPKGKFLEITPEMWQEGFQGLFVSAQEAMRAALPSMEKAGWGRIILVTSMVAREPAPGMTVSNAIRAGLLGLTKSVSREVAARGVTVNTVLPGFTRTERLQELGLSEDRMRADIPANRLGEPEELAALVAFLASEKAAYVTGQAIACDGGFLRSL